MMVNNMVIETCPKLTIFRVTVKHVPDNNSWPWVVKEVYLDYGQQ